MKYPEGSLHNALTGDGHGGIDDASVLSIGKRPRTIQIRRPDGTMEDFLARMSNKFQFSKCERPHKPITAARTEFITVELRSDLLTITAQPENTQRTRRIYAQRTIDLDGASTYVILAQLPRAIVDADFFPATGTIVLFEPTPSGPRHLRAAGIDTNSRRCHGWIFDALEI